MAEHTSYIVSNDYGQSAFRTLDDVARSIDLSLETSPIRKITKVTVIEEDVELPGFVLDFNGKFQGNQSGNGGNLI